MRRGWPTRAGCVRVANLAFFGDEKEINAPFMTQRKKKKKGWKKSDLQEPPWPRGELGSRGAQSGSDLPKGDPDFSGSTFQGLGRTCILYIR